MACGIYKITNIVNGKMYIGQSVDIDRRWKEHVYDSKNGSSIIYRAMRKYGVDNFKFDIVQECEASELDDLEIEYIDTYNTYVHSDNSNGYNETLGGSGIVGYIHTEKDRVKAMINRHFAMKYKNGLVKYKMLKDALSKSCYKRDIRIEKNLECGEIAIIHNKENYLIKSVGLNDIVNMDIDEILQESIETMEGNDTMEELCNYWSEMGLYSSYEEFFS